MSKSKNTEKHVDANANTNTNEKEKAEPKMNKNTLKANLRLDVNTRARWIASYLKNNKLKVLFTKKESDETKTTYEDFPNISGSQFAITAVEQTLLSSVINIAFKKTTKTKEGLYNITDNIIIDSVNLDNSLSKIFSKELMQGAYDSSTDYVKLLEINKKDEIVQFIEKYACDSTKVHIDDSGMNFLMYLLQENRKKLIHTAYCMLCFAGKKTINFRAIEFSVRVHYSHCKSLCDLFLKKLDEVSTLVDEANKAEAEERKAEKAEKEKGENTEKEEKCSKTDKTVKAEKATKEVKETPKETKALKTDKKSSKETKKEIPKEAPKETKVEKKPPAKTTSKKAPVPAKKEETDDDTEGEKNSDSESESVSSSDDE